MVLGWISSDSMFIYIFRQARVRITCDTISKFHSISLTHIYMELNNDVDQLANHVVTVAPGKLQIKHTLLSPFHVPRSYFDSMNGGEFVYLSGPSQILHVLAWSLIDYSSIG